MTGAPTAGPTVHNNILAFGSAHATALAASGLVSTACNAFWANAGGNRNGALDPTDFVADPLFCDPVTDNLHLLSVSPCLAANNPACGLVGALGVGCAPVSVETSSWGRTKSLFR